MVGIPSRSELGPRTVLSTVVVVLVGKTKSSCILSLITFFCSSSTALSCSVRVLSVSSICDMVVSSLKLVFN